MKTLVVYESMFGNTEQIARAIAEGLGESGDVRVAEVSDAPSEPDPEVELIVAGGPTHAFSMSRTKTRADAIGQGAHEGEREFGLREWMAALPSGHHTEKMATFDTKIASMRHLPGSAAKGAAKAAGRHGYESVARAESF
jgi:Flavodoxin